MVPPSQVLSADLIHELAIEALPAGFVVGVVGEAGCGVEALFERARQAGRVVLDRPFTDVDAVARELAIAGLLAQCRQGAAVLLYSHDEALVARLCDEVWWLHDGGVAARGNAREVLRDYRRHVARRLAAELALPGVAPAFRRGDRRAELQTIEALGADGAASGVWVSGEACAVRVVVRFRDAVGAPVVGILLRTRVGLDVFGTNTELEGIRLGPVTAGETLEVTFRFVCALCPQEYTITAASHDPDGVWHDWMEDAIAVTVADTRYTAGVANLRATVEVKRA